MTTEARHAHIALFVPHAGCPHDCAFCNQRTIAGVSRPLTPSDVTAACERALGTLGDRTAQIAFFGGSFTAIDRGYMVSLLEAAQPFLKDERIEGIRISTRPDAIDREVLDVLRRYGVTAIELGAQSMDDRVLSRCGRGHTAKAVEDAAHLIREYGFSLGLQMMTGLPADTAAGAMETAKKLATLQPDTMRIYPTVVLEGTALADRMRRGEYVPPTLEESVALCAELLCYFERTCGIRVIRLGLHDGDSLREQAIAGAYHPAFRELCEGQLYVNTAMAVLTRMGPCDAVRTVRVNPKAVSKLIGQRKCHLARFRERGFCIEVKGDPTVPLWEVAVDEKGTSV